MNMAIIYGVITVLSLLLFLGYCCIVQKKDTWFVLLYISVFVVNLGYFALAISTTLGEAMLANRIAYLGSVFLPLCMLMIIMDVCRIDYSKIFLGMMITISILTFLLAASGGYLDWYYKEVSVVMVNGAAVLEKEYGPLHNWYFVYLALYFGMMIGTILVSYWKKRLVSYRHALLLASLVLGNIMIWFIEQLIHWDFEFLSVSYIVTELYLLLLHDMLQDYEAAQQILIRQREPLSEYKKIELLEWAEQEEEIVAEEEIMQFEELKEEEPAARQELLETLTAREWDVLKHLLENKKRKEIAEELNVTENTVKKHTSHIFTKLRVASRKELFETYDITKE